MIETHSFGHLDHFSGLYSHFSTVFGLYSILLIFFDLLKREISTIHKLIMKLIRICPIRINYMSYTFHVLRQIFGILHSILKYLIRIGVRSIEFEFSFRILNRDQICSNSKQNSKIKPSHASLVLGFAAKGGGGQVEGCTTNIIISQ